MSNRGIELNCIQKCGDYFYDFSAAIISVIDVITDILVTYEFWILGRKVYFGIAVAIFILAQFCYALLFTMAYGETLTRDRFRALCFMCIFPFAQIVPVFMWLDSYNVPCIKRILKYFSLSQHVIDINRKCPENKDKLQFWLEQKFMSHGGFIIEAAIEAFPQSILQMIAIVMYQEATPLNVVSIVISMTSVASKMLMFSYSIDRVTFMFNFFCMVSDIFGIFCTLSWVFYHPEENFGFKTFDSFTIAGQIFIIKICSMVGLCILCGLLLGLVTLLYNCTDAFCVRGREDYLKCCPCCFYNPDAYTHTGNHTSISHTSTPCDNCKVNCIFCLFACKICWHELCCQGGRRRIQHNPNSKTRTRKCCEKCCRKCKGYTWKKCRRTTCDFITGILALIAVIAFIALAPVAAVFLFGIAVMALEIAKLVFIPAMFYMLDSQKHRGNVKFYKPIFDYLLSGRNKQDYHVRLAIVNYTCSEEWSLNHKYIKSSIDSLDSDKKIDSDFIHGLEKNLGPHFDWLKALMIPNTFYYLQQTRKVSEMKKKRKERQNVELTLRQMDNKNMKNSKHESETVELKVSVDSPRNDVSNNTTTTTTTTVTDVSLECTTSVGISSNVTTYGTGDQSNYDVELKMEDEEEYKYQLSQTDPLDQFSSVDLRSVARISIDHAQHIGPIKKGIDMKQKDERDRQLALIPDHADDDIKELENWIKHFELRKDNYSESMITKYVSDNPHDITHLLTFKPKDYRNITKTGPLHMLHVLFVEVVQTAWKEITGDVDYKNINNCGRICAFFGLFFLCVGIYILVPLAVLLVLTSLFYPIIAITMTYFVSGVEAIHYLQLTLTAVYVCVLVSLLIMTPRVYKFQHANYHFYASRWNIAIMGGRLDVPREQQFALKYIQLYATMQRNKIIKDFWGDLYGEFMQFLTPTHHIDIKKIFSQNIWKNDEKHIALLEKQVINTNNAITTHRLLDYMD